MATIFTHSFIAVIFGKFYAKSKMPRHFWSLSIMCSILPDIDVIGFYFGINYSDVIGHRGLTHSLLFAAVVALVVVLLAFRDIPKFSKKWWGLFFYFFVLTASHGVVDALTDGGLGVAFFAPFDNTRYFFPWRPLLVSPIGAQHFFTKYGMEVLLAELLWIWLPLLVFRYLFVGMWKYFTQKKA